MPFPRVLRPLAAAALLVSACATAPAPRPPAGPAPPPAPPQAAPPAAPPAAPLPLLTSQRAPWATAAAPAPGEPSYDETLAWLQQVTQAHATAEATEPGTGGRYRLSTRLGVPRGATCALEVFHLRTRLDAAQADFSDRAVIPLEALFLDEVVLSYPFGLEVTVGGPPPVTCVQVRARHRWISYWTSNAPGGTNARSESAICLDGAAPAQPLLEAMRRLARLCGSLATRPPDPPVRR